MVYFSFLILLLSYFNIHCSPSARYSNNSNNSDGSQADIVKENIFYGEASYYADKFHGRKTANGEIFDMYKISAAHKTLPFNTLLQVTNLENQKTVVVRINDRGPYKKGRVLDLSYGAARKIDMVSSGVVKVKVKIVKLGEK